MNAHRLPSLIRRSRSALVIAALVSTLFALREVPPLASPAPASASATYA